MWRPGPPQARHAAAVRLGGWSSRIDTIERRVAGLPGLTLAGAAYRGVGLADCVRSGEAAAEATLLG